MKMQAGRPTLSIVRAAILGLAALTIAQAAGAQPQVSDPTMAQSDGGKKKALPVANDDNTLDFVFHMNQDVIGPLVCEVDPTSGGTDPEAFIPCELPQNLPAGAPSTATPAEYNLKARFPPDMLCKGRAGSLENVCVLMIRINKTAGPTSNTSGFTQGPNNAALKGEP